MRDPLYHWAHLSCTQRVTERGTQDRLLPLNLGHQEEGRASTGWPSSGDVVADGGGRPGATPTLCAPKGGGSSLGDHLWHPGRERRWHGTATAGGGGAPVTSGLRRGAREVRREAREVVWWLVRAEGDRRLGIDGGSELGPCGHRAATLWLRARRPRRAHGREKGLARLVAHTAATAMA
jgi:hypothetical protein